MDCIRVVCYGMCNGAVDCMEIVMGGMWWGLFIEACEMLVQVFSLPG